MKRFLVLAALAVVPPMASLLACEGEPPINAPEPGDEAVAQGAPLRLLP